MRAIIFDIDGTLADVSHCLPGSLTVPQSELRWTRYPACSWDNDGRWDQQYG